MSRITAAFAVVITACAAWLSQATLAPTGEGSAQVALFPLSAASFLIAIGAAVFVWAAWRCGASLAPLWLLMLIALPWIPGAPAALLIWSGPMVLMVWAAVVLSMLSTIRVGRRFRLRQGSGGLAVALAEAVSPGVLAGLKPRPTLLAGGIALVVYAFAAWQVSPWIPGGDEPHYLIITQSILEDHDLKIENNHRQGDYRAYFAGELPKPDYRRRGRDGQIYSIHAPGLPALIAPAFAIGGYRGVVIFLVLVASAGSALAWRLAWLVTRRTDAAWFGWAAITLSTSEIFHSFTVYPDGVGGVLVLTGVWALLRAERESQTGLEAVTPWWLHGLALAALPWIHTRFALLAGGLGALVLLRLSTTKNSAAKAVAFLAIPAISALCWVGFFIAIYGTPDPAAPYANEEGAASFIPGGLAGLFFDQRFGVLVYSPVLICALAGLIAMIRQRTLRRLGLELLFVLVPYLLTVTHFAMWWGGTSAPGRFLVPVLLMMTIPAAVGWTAIRRRATRVTMWAALAGTVFMSSALILVGRGRLAYNIRQAPAQVLDWLNASASLALGAPSWWQGQQITRMALARDAAIWAASFTAAWLLLRVLETRTWLRTRGPLAAAAGAVYAAAVMLSLTIVWAVSGAETVDRAAAQLDVLRRLSREPNVAAVAFPDLDRVPLDAVPAMLRIRPRPSGAPGGAGANDRPLYQIPAVPAGTYRVRPQLANDAGWLMIGIGRDQFSLSSAPVASDVPALTFPVDVRGIIVRGDEQARRAVRAITIEPVSVVPEARRLTTEYARHAVRYGTAAVYFLDDRSFPEPEGFWVGGRRDSSVVIQPASLAPSVTLLVRNAPLRNQVILQAGTLREDLQLAPGEERRVAVPIDPARAAALLRITVTGGFRPSATDPNSRDDRFLGVWVKVE